MVARLYHYFVLRPYWIALLIAVILCIWLLSKPNQVVQPGQTSSQKRENLPKVQTVRFTPEQIIKSLTLYGQSEANSHAVIRAKVAGEVSRIKVEKGSHVRSQQEIADIDKAALPEQLKEAQGLYAERLLNYKAVKSLNEKGLQEATRLAEANSSLLAAQTAFKKIQLNLQYSTIRAPFAGVLQTQFAQQGDYLQIGDPLFRLESLDPIVIRGDATEHYIHLLTLGQSVSATLLSGQKIAGKISYIASYADPQSSTFRIEAEFANPDFKMLAGISAKLSIPLYRVDAIYVSPAVLAIDAGGQLGVKAVRGDRVVFQKTDLVEADNDGVWLSGFTQPVDIITLGQGFVNAGDRVAPEKKR